MLNKHSKEIYRLFADLQSSFTIYFSFKIPKQITSKDSAVSFISSSLNEFLLSVWKAGQVKLNPNNNYHVKVYAYYSFT